MAEEIEFAEGGVPFDVAPQGEQPKEKPAAPAGESAEDLGIVQAGEAAFAPPRSPLEYRVEEFGSGEPEDIKAEQAIRETLFAEGIPTFAGNVVYEALQRSLRDGEPSEETLASRHSAGMAELERRHGEGAKAIVADAQAVAGRLCQRWPDFADLLEQSGAGNDVHLIETLARVHRVQSKRRA